MNKLSLNTRSRLILIGVICCALLYLKRVAIAHQMVDFLVLNEEIPQMKTGFVLAGDVWSRSEAAITLHQKGTIQDIVCTGGVPHPLSRIFNKTDLLESEVAVMYIDSFSNISKQQVHLHPGGTSTKEEAHFILDYCKQNQLQECVIITSSLHSRRCQLVFKRLFETEGIKTYIHGADILYYNERDWWKDDEALRFVLSEYIKLILYAAKGYLSL